MKLIPPLVLGSGDITSNATETVSDWASGTTYAADDTAIYGNWIYTSLQAANTGNQPDTSPTWWSQTAPSNTWAMFDTQVSTQTTRNATMSITIAPGVYFTSLALLNMSAQSVDVTVVDGAETLFNQTYDLNQTVILDWYGYFFEPYDYATSIIETNIPPSTTAEITVDFDNGASDVAVGVMVLGTAYELGDSEYGASLGIRDYSTKDTDADGVTTFVEGAFSKRLDANVFCGNGAIPAVAKLLQEVRATPAVWQWSTQDRYSPATIFGYARDWSIAIQYTNHSILSLDIEGLT